MIPLYTLPLMTKNMVYVPYGRQSKLTDVHTEDAHSQLPDSKGVLLLSHI